jgi:hypothetical protein
MTMIVQMQVAHSSQIWLGIYTILVCALDCKQNNPFLIYVLNASCWFCTPGEVSRNPTRCLVFPIKGTSCIKTGGAWSTTRMKQEDD